MIEMACQNCASKVSVRSCLAAAQQTCSRCCQRGMGKLESSRRTARPAGFDDRPPSPQLEPRSDSSSGMWLGMLAGVLAGIGLVAAVAYLGAAIPREVRGGILGALTGVLLAPILAL